jgi:hypothetical protein
MKPLALLASAALVFGGFSARAVGSGSPSAPATNAQPSTAASDTGAGSAPAVAPPANPMQPATPAPDQAPPPPPAPQAKAPTPAPAQAPAQAAASPPTVPAGQWVYTVQYGWVWMPYDSQYTHVYENDGSDPYMYLYYPAYGWTWVVAPWIWGFGPVPWFGVRGWTHFYWYGHGAFGHPWYGYRTWYGHRGPVQGRTHVGHPAAPHAPSGHAGHH